MWVCESMLCTYYVRVSTYLCMNLHKYSTEPLICSVLFIEFSAAQAGHSSFPLLWSLLVSPSLFLPASLISGRKRWSKLLHQLWQQPSGQSKSWGYKSSKLRVEACYWMTEAPIPLYVFNPMCNICIQGISKSTFIISWQNVENHVWSICIRFALCTVDPPLPSFT